MTSETNDAFDTAYSPRRVEFWLAHFEELETLVRSPKSSAHVAEHLNREWVMLQVRLRFCLCQEAHAVDSRAVDPACQHEPTGGGAYRAGPETALCVLSDLRHAAEHLPPGWLATRKIWWEELIPQKTIIQRVTDWRHQVRHGQAYVEREPAFARTIAVNRMANQLGWSKHELLSA
jgi:hypothetical protein